MENKENIGAQYEPSQSLHLSVPAISYETGQPSEEWSFRRGEVPRVEKFTVEVDNYGSSVGVTYQPPKSLETEVKTAVILSPGFTAGSLSFYGIQKALAGNNIPSYSLDHHRKYDHKVTVQEVHAINDLAVMGDAYNRHHFEKFILVGWSMGGGDILHATEMSGITRYDTVEQLILLEAMGQIKGDTFSSVAKKMTKAVIEDFKLTRKLPLKERFLIARAALDSMKRASKNLNQTAAEAQYAASFDIRELIKESIKNNIPVSQITGHLDMAFPAVDCHRDTSDIEFKRRVVLVGQYATHIAGMFVPRSTAKAIEACCETL